MPSPEQMPNPTLRLVYWTQIQMEDAERADAAYQEALAVFPEVSDMLKISFIPSKIHYRFGRVRFRVKRVLRPPGGDNGGRTRLTGSENAGANPIIQAILLLCRTGFPFSGPAAAGLDLKHLYIWGWKSAVIHGFTDKQVINIC